MIQYQGLKSLETLENAKNYNQWIVEQFHSILSFPLLEVGAGTGNISLLLPQKGEVVLSDSDSGLVKFLQKKFVSQKHVITEQIDITKNPVSRFRNHFASIVAINVLEHIQDDSKAIKNLYKMLQKAGKLGILVPANQFAYTDVDEKLGHFRRYEKNELIKKITSAGFEIEKIYPFNFVGLVGWFVLHKMPRKSQQLNSSQISLFEKLVPFLRFVEKVIPIPLGISFIVIASKKG